MPRSPILAAAPASTALLAALLVAPAATGRPPSSYVALGDSYSSGVGTRSYISDGTSCQRSVYAFPSLIAAEAGYELNFRACSGARISDVAGNQVGALSRRTSFVTVSVGGNDAGFADVLTECAGPWWYGDCNGAIDDAQRFIRDTLPGRISGLYAAIRDEAPNATVVVVGYPRIFMGEDCNAGTWFSPEEQSRLNATADLLNGRLASAASAGGFAFADATGAFTGHAVCDDVEWLNGLSNPVSESYHPNRPGHRSGYTPLVGPVLTGADITVNRGTVRRARSSADEQAVLQRQYADADRHIEPEAFRRPDLSSPEARADARHHGVDPDRWLSLHG